MVRGQPRLNQHPSAFRAASRSTRHLTEELKAALGRPEIGQIDADIRVDNTYQRHVGKIESFCDHLRAEQNVDFSSCNAVENVGVSPFAARCVHVHPRHARRWEPLA